MLNKFLLILRFILFMFSYRLAIATILIQLLGQELLLVGDFKSVVATGINLTVFNSLALSRVHPASRIEVWTIYFFIKLALSFNSRLSCIEGRLLLTDLVI